MFAWPQAGPKVLNMKTKYTTNQLTKTLGFNLRSTRVKNKTSVADLAEFCNVSAQTIYNYENGSCLPSPNSANLLREFFGIPSPVNAVATTNGKSKNSKAPKATATSRRTITVNGTSTKKKSAK